MKKKDTGSDAFRVHHNVLCYAYTIEIDRAGRFDVDRARNAGDSDSSSGIRLQKGEQIEAEDGTLWRPEDGSRTGKERD